MVFTTEASNVCLAYSFSRSLCGYQLTDECKDSMQCESVASVLDVKVCVFKKRIFRNIKLLSVYHIT